MLVPVTARERTAVIARWRGDAGRKHLLQRFFVRRDASAPPARLLVDDPQAPRFLLAVQGARLAVHGPRREVRRWLRMLAAAPGEAIPRWPDAPARRQWQESEAGRPFIRVVHIFASFRHELLRAGFVSANEQSDWHEPHYVYWVAGRPRFAHLVQHACRLGAGQELHALLRTGIHYDEDGSYTRMCLDAGPSFVCEVRQRGRTVPVCWSCTHLGGTMGMIYTPEKFRGQGYATSLAAFQIDHMLTRDGIALAQIRWNNVPSQRIMDKFGARRTREPLTHGVFYWK